MANPLSIHRRFLINSLIILCLLFTGIGTAGLLPVFAQTDEIVEPEQQPQEGGDPTPEGGDAPAAVETDTEEPPPPQPTETFTEVPVQVDTSTPTVTLSQQTETPSPQATGTPTPLHTPQPYNTPTLTATTSGTVDLTTTPMGTTTTTITTTATVTVTGTDLTATATTSATVTPTESIEGVYAPDEVIVKFDPDLSDVEKDEVIEDVEAVVEDELDVIGVTILKIEKGRVSQVVNELESSGDVEYVEPNYQYEAFEPVIPDDPYWGNQYGLAKIQAPDGWAIDTGSSAVTLAVLDTGVDVDHPDLASKVLPGYNAITGIGDGTTVMGVADDDHYHGTHVAGIAAAITDNSLGVAGVSWGARILPVKVLDSTGYGTSSDIADGIIWATDNGAKVINMSLGGTGYSSTLEDACNYAYSHGVTIVAAAGNSGTYQTTYPASYDHVIAVAATDSSNNRAGFSTYGNFVDIAAPGVNIYATYIGGSYTYLSGTSMASPMVAGVAAILAGLSQYDTPDKIEVALESTALDRGSAGWDMYYGNGVVQLENALNFDTSSITPSPTPTATIPPIGYYSATSEECPTGAQYAWMAASSGTGLTGDDGYAEISLPFTFYFNNVPYTTVHVSTNGILSFGPENASAYYNSTIPNTYPPNEIIAPFWDDLNNSFGGTINYDIRGASPDRQFVVEWNQMPFYAGTGNVSFQAILFESSNDILFLYGPSSGNGDGRSATVGIEYNAGSFGYQYSYNSAILYEGLAIRYSPNPIFCPTPTPTATLPPLDTGTYDDTSSSIYYSANWVSQSLSGNYSSTEHYSATSNSYASLVFNGEGLNLIYRSHPLFGELEVSIDGIVVDTVNQYSQAEQKQRVWSSGGLAPGNHTLYIRHVSGQYVTLDAVAVSGPPPTATVTATATETPLPVGVGTYDDGHAQIDYSAGWVSQTLSGNYDNSEHYSATVGSTAGLAFQMAEAGSISLLYRAHPAFGIMNISIDGEQVAALNQYASSQVLQKMWTSGALDVGTHTLSVTHVSGSYVTLDAITVSGPPPTATVTATATETPLPVGVGTYDDRHVQIDYSGGWVSQTLSGNYDNSEHYSATVGSTAGLTFQMAEAGSISLLYRAHPAFGVLNVSIDGVQVAALNQYATSQVQQRSWTSSGLDVGTHTLSVSHASGSYVTLDAITVSGPPPTATVTATATITPTVTETPLPVGVGIYDNPNENIFYSNGWNAWTGTGPYLNTLHYSTLIGSNGSFVFTGQSVSLVYLRHPSYGVLNISIDGVQVATLNQYSSTTAWQQRWNSDPLVEGTHTLSVTHASGSYVNVDAIEVSGPPPTATVTATATETPLPVGVGTYDDRHAQIDYSAGWVAQTLSGNYDNSEHYSATVGSTAGLAFQMAEAGSISLLYRAHPAFGVLNVSIDGVQVAALNQYASSQVQQRSWTSSGLDVGTHTLSVTHATGSYVTLDAITVSGPPPTATVTATATETPLPVGVGTYDDRHVQIDYSGGWVSQTLNGNYDNSEHYSATVGSTAGLTFQMAEAGSISLLYRAHSAFGIMNISIDGVQVAALNQYASSQALQKIWTSSGLDVGTHTLSVTHASGSYVTLDAITVSGPPPTATVTATVTQTPLPLANGYYDERNSAFEYSGNWLQWSGSGPYNGTLTYSTGIGSSVSLVFNGESIAFLYTGHPTRGNVNVKIDGVLVATVNEYASDYDWQAGWSIGNLSPGNHTLELVHATGQYVDIDAVMVGTDVNVERVELIQGTSMNDAYQVHIAGRPAIFRAFVGLTGPTSQDGVNARLTRYVSGVAQDSIDAGPVTIQSTTDEGDLNQTLNFELPSNWLTGGTSYVLQLDPNDDISEISESNNRYPDSGEQSFDFVSADALDIVIVPVIYARTGITPTSPNTADLSYLTWMAERVYPVSTINYSLHDSITFTGDLRTSSGWSALLNQVTSIQSAEDPTNSKAYYGVVNFYAADGCSSGCIIGMGWVGYPASVGFSGWGAGTVAGGETMVHEIGHNFGRYHSPCGNPAGVDPGWPAAYTNATIGAWGYDIVTGALYDPAARYDYMSYCDPTWTSDYTYRSIYNYRLSSAWSAGLSSTYQKAVYLGGSISAAGEVHMTPGFVQDAPVQTALSSGTHSIELLDISGTVLNTFYFYPRQIADSEGASGFSFFVPAVDDLARIRLYSGSTLLYDDVFEYAQ